MMAVMGAWAISTRKSVECSCTDPVYKEKRWPGESKEVGAATFHSEERGECINEECEEDVCGVVNKELGEIEKKTGEKGILQYGKQDVRRQQQSCGKNGGG